MPFKANILLSLNADRPIKLDPILL